MKKNLKMAVNACIDIKHGKFVCVVKVYGTGTIQVQGVDSNLKEVINQAKAAIENDEGIGDMLPFEVEGALYKSFKTRVEAEAALEFPEHYFNLRNEQEGETIKQRKAKTSPATELIMDSTCVDASYLGNPGDVEYRDIHTGINKVLFHKSPMSNGTNNLGEFLAIVHGLAYLKKEDRDIPIYSDSEIAILWVRNKKVQTELNQSIDNEEIFYLVAMV
ncbi:hypothetical protein [Trichormus azollae]|nr:hypothetical protein [Trichormus azollae]